MQINITGRHNDVTDAMKEYASLKCEKLSRFDDRVNLLDITLTVEGPRNSVEVIATASAGVRVVAKETSADMYAAIDAATDKMEAQLKKNKEKIRDKRGITKLDFTVPAEPDADSDEDSYEEIIEKTEF